MRLDDIQLSDGNHFVAMEYYAAIMNRTFLVLITEESINGIVVRGVVASNDRGDPLTRLITGKLSPDGDLTNPNAYIDEKYRKQYNDIDLTSADMLKVHKANFRVALSEISGVSYDPSKKRGMGPYPHDGRVCIGYGGSEREFIILGNQSGEKIASSIRARLSNTIA